MYDWENQDPLPGAIDLPVYVECRSKETLSQQSKKQLYDEKSPLSLQTQGAITTTKTKYFP